MYLSVDVIEVGVEMESTYLDMVLLISRSTCKFLVYSQDVHLAIAEYVWKYLSTSLNKS